MMQKTSIARTLVMIPREIFDEPTNGLDIMTLAPSLHLSASAATSANRHLLHPHHERSRKALRHHRHHPIRQAPCRRYTRQLRDKYAEHDLEEIFIKVVTPHYVAEDAN